MRRKGAPKSKSPKVSKENPLGDSSCSDDDNVPSTPPTPHVNSGSAVFRTPTVDENATDYGLEFTNSTQIRNPSPRRCSTLRNAHHSSGESPRSDTSVRSAQANRAKAKAPKTSAQANRANAKAPKTSAQANRANAAPSKTTAHSKRQVFQNLHMQDYMKSVVALHNFTGYLIPRLPFARFVREIIYSVSTDQTIDKITAQALEGLQAATEMYITQCLQDAYLLTMHRGRVTLTKKDFELLKFLRLNSLQQI